MPIDIIGFSEAAPGTGTVEIAGAGGDTFYRVEGDDIIIKDKKSYVLGVFAAAESTGARVLLRQPDLKLDYEFLKCMLLADLDPTQGWTHLFGRPLPLAPSDKLNALCVNATDEDTIIGVMLGSGKISQASLDAVNPTHTITGYSDTTLTANTWTACAITWNQDLPKGEYAVVGMKVGAWIASGIMSCIARLTGIEGSRIGVPVAIMEADHEEFQSITTLPFVNFPLMPTVKFPHNDMPSLECLSPAALTDENIELLLQKVA